MTFPSKRASTFSRCGFQFALAGALAMSVSLAYANDDQAMLIKHLPDTKTTLVEAINQSAKSEGYPISAKFEMDDAGKLMLSVYTAEQGRDAAAAGNELVELIGDATQAPWVFKKDVFPDKEHIAEAAMQLTLMQVSKLTLVELLAKAAADNDGDEDDGGMIFSISPETKDGKAAFRVSSMASGPLSYAWLFAIFTASNLPLLKIAAISFGWQT